MGAAVFMTVDGAVEVPPAVADYIRDLEGQITDLEDRERADAETYGRLRAQVIAAQTEALHWRYAAAACGLVGLVFGASLVLRWLA